MKQLSKTILILAICAWTGNGTSLLNASNSIRVSRANIEEIQQRHHRGQPMSQHRIMGDKDFQFLYKTIKKKSFDKDRLELLSVGVLDNYFSCRQCAKIMSLCSFDDDKLEILDIMVGHIDDLENMETILDSFKFDSNRRKAADKLEKRRR